MSSLKIQLFLAVLGSWFQDPSRIPKSMDDQISDIKWCGVCIELTHILPIF